MSKSFTEGQEFKEKDYTHKALPKGAYEECTFISCDFSNSDLSGMNFVECEFLNSGLSMANLANTTLRSVRFRGCKMLGLHFEHCNELLFSANFEGCQLDLSSFYQRPMKNTAFKDCRLQEVDFTEADLTGSSFEYCNLSGAIFEHTILEKADFRSAHDFIIDPERNRLRKAKFSAGGLAGLLGKYGIEVE
ncbi:MAG: pentapeptide repeat-containing protein [Lewinellaceae bacterium]|nr:pentapeptide repeat-containing protein [Phaeodactylibacter sp.]MCB9038165.1 pentapeptide repeat-containing protein [Lewinellaceae bacterium]